MAEKGLFIEALPRDGLVTFLALVKDKGLRPKRAGGWYLYLLLSDRTGDLEAKAWDSPQQTAALFERDDIVKVRGTIELYNDRPQLIVQRIRRCEEGEFQEADFCPASARDPEEMFRELQGFVDSRWQRPPSSFAAVGPDGPAGGHGDQGGAGRHASTSPLPGWLVRSCDLLMRSGRESH